MKWFLILIFPFLFFNSCQLEQTKQRDENRQSDQIFPDKIGDHWVYLYNPGVDDIENNAQIVVSVVGQRKLPNGVSANLWKYEYPEYIDTLWVVSNDSTAKFYGKPCWNCTNPMPSLKMEYQFPLKKGKKWFTAVPYGDTTKVFNLSDISVPAGIFDSTFKVSKKIGYVTNSWTKDTLWFKCNVGLIKKYQFEVNLGPVTGNGYWYLKSYKIE